MARLVVLLIVLMPALHAIGAPMGRLFLTPDERAQLDRLRNNQGEAIAVATPQRQLTLNGVVTRGNGKTTAWVNQQPQTDFTSTVQGVNLRPTTIPATISLQLSSGQRIQLKAGQTFDTTSGSVSEGYEASTPVISRPEPQ
jgi:LEA14-like dessication related protein